jgi:radical SAM protein with 4Fe4S-binding SPASM domain
MKKARYGYSFLRKRMVHLNLQILYACNFRCKICDFWKAPYKDMPRISLDQVQIITGKLKTLGPLIISIGGGEPLLHPDLVEITRCLAVNNFPVMICNGWFVTPENARALFKAGLHEVSISLDYADPQKHDRQRGMAGAFQRAVNALKILMENRMSARQRVHMISVVMKDNLEDIEPLILLAKEIGVTFLVTRYSSERGKKSAQALPKEVGAYLVKLKKKHRDFVSLPGYLERFGEPVSPCFAGKNLFNIDSQGQVTRCIDTLDDPVGNIISDDLIPVQEKLLAQYRESNCEKCWTSCRGSIETLMYGKKRLTNLRQCRQITRPVSLSRHS